MKIILSLVVLFGIFSDSFGQTNLEKCPDIKPVEPILTIEYLLGTWYAMRIGPPCEEYGNATWDCVTETFWIDKDTPKNIINTVYHHRVNGTREDYKGLINTTKTTPESEYVWDYQLTGMSIPTTYVATDNGKSWAIAFSCIEMEPGNATATWGIASRFRTIDPKLEQTLVQEVERLSGISGDELMGIGQNECF